MEMQEGHGSGNNVICTGDIQRIVGEFMQYSADQVMLLEHFFVECQKPSHLMRVALIRGNPALSSLNSQQIQAWFEHRRFLEEKKMDSFVLNLFIEKVVAIGRVLLLENDFLHGEVQWLLREKAYIRKLLQYASLESFLALEVPRSVFKNVKLAGTRRVLLLHNEYLHNEVQQMHRQKEYILNLLENVSNTEFVVDTYCSWSRVADSSKGYSSVQINLERILNMFVIQILLGHYSILFVPYRLRLLSGTRAKFLSITPSELNRVSVPRIKPFGGLKDISVDICSDLTNFSVNGITFYVFVMLSFVKAAMITDGPLDFLRKHQEFILCCSVKGFRVVVGGYCVSGAWIYFPNEQAAHGNVKLIVRFNFVN